MAYFSKTIALAKLNYCGGESSSSMSSAGTSNRSKDEIRNTQRREIVGTDREQRTDI
jgi:hypothetical protein